MLDRRDLDELSKFWPVHGKQFQYPTGKWNCSVAEIAHSSPDETTVVLKFNLAPDDSNPQQVLQRHLTLTFTDFKFVRDIGTARRYAEGLHIAILDLLCSEAASAKRRIP